MTLVWWVLGGQQRIPSRLPPGTEIRSRAVVVELVAGKCHVVFDRHGFAAADDLNQVVGAGEDAVAVVLSDMAQVLHHKGGGAQGAQRGGEGRDADWFVADRDAQGLSDFPRDGVVIEFL